MTDSQQKAAAKEKFPRVFWTANLTELFERSAYYAVASFVVIYLGQLGLGDYWPSILSSTVLWGLVYFLPILSGAIADQVGFKKSLLVAFVLMMLGYAMEGAPVWLGLGELSPAISAEINASAATVALVVAGIVLIGFGASVIKPCISGTVQKTAGSRATLAFAIFYMVINIGSLVGRVISYFFRTRLDLSYIWAVAAAFCALTFFLVLLFYREPEQPAGRPRKSVAQVLAGMVLVLRDRRFSLFLVVTSGFWFLYNQVYNVIPLYWKKVLETNPAADLYTAANPLTIVLFQLLVTRLFGKMKPVRSIIVGNLIIGVAMLAQLLPLLLSPSIRDKVWNLLPLASLFGIMSVSLVAFGELFASPRAYEYIGALAPKGQEGLFLGYANLPVALGALTGGPVGAAIFNEVMCRGASLRADGLLELDPFQNALGWIILGGVGVLCALVMWLFDRWLRKQQPAS